MSDVDSAALHALLDDTDARDKFAALAQAACRLVFGIALLLKPARAQLCRGLMVACSDARRTFRLATLFALRKAIAIRDMDRIGGCLHLVLMNGLFYDFRAWLRQRGLLNESLYVADVKSADFNVGLSNAAILLRGSIQSGSRLTLLALMRLVQFLHDVLHANIYRPRDAPGACGHFHAPGHPPQWAIPILGQEWSPARSVEQIIDSVLSVLKEPNPDDPSFKDYAEEDIRAHTENVQLRQRERLAEQQQSIDTEADTYYRIDINTGSSSQ